MKCLGKKMLMEKKQQQYVCADCGYESKKWSGKCLTCGAWNTMSVVKDVSRGSHTKLDGQVQELSTLDATESSLRRRIQTGYEEVDRILGAGLVQGSVTLIGGDPGVGKSTLLMQLVNNIATEKNTALYVSGEESVDQIRERAKRLRIDNPGIKLLACHSLADILRTVTATPSIAYVIIDSIQTIHSGEMVSGMPGSIGQIKSSTYGLVTLAKEHNITVVIIGHITKEGTVAGPKLLEHMVDTVIYFEGEKQHQFRLLRAIKNRFGPTNEIGMFQMTDNALVEVKNPSSLFLTQHHRKVSGSIVFAGLEGTRPILVEIQALVSSTYMASPRRTVVGWDQNRLAMILAILSTRLDLPVADKEIYLNIVGGIRVQETAADLAVAIAIISATRNIPLAKHYASFGEIGLAGEIRPVPMTSLRIREACKLGFNQVILPRSDDPACEKYTTVEHVTDLNDLFGKCAAS